MRIVCLDGYTLNPGDLSWERFEALGEFAVHDRTPPALTVERAADTPIALTNKTVLDSDVIAKLPGLRYIGVLATGYNVVDLEAAAERGIIVTNVPAYSTEAVAQLVFAHLLNLTHHVALHDASVKRGDWTRADDFCYWLTPLVELDGLTLGIVGLGRIGRAVARIARAFGMNVLAHDPAVTDAFKGGGSGDPPPRENRADTPPHEASEVELVDLDRLFRESDVVTLHCPLNDDTRHVVNARRLATMKPTAFLINASRGPVVDERALADALNAGRLAAAGVDVLSTEPPSPDNPLVAARNCVVTPHIAWATRAARQRLMNVAADNLQAFLDGSPRNVVTPRA
ncbi:MAG TPA: D-2-hydroxyacid dehydrogenase [Planctomycetota bacterium]|nr:D-2-hydroxyacid dehydrogenase [Planctomycetota bacterium]